MKKFTKILGLIFAITLGICLSFLLRNKGSHFANDIAYLKIRSMIDL